VALEAPVKKRGRGPSITRDLRRARIDATAEQ
jgi:hypothetical protein